MPVISELLKCPVLAMIYIDTHLAADLSNACAVLNYVEANFNCLPLPEEPEPDPVTPGDEDDEWVDEGGNDDDPDDDYNEYLRKPIWWYHTDHLGSSTYLTDNFGRPSHYYETLPFGEMMVEHNQSKYYKVPYPTTNTGSYDNKWKFNGKELDDATQLYYYGARYYDPRISIFLSVDPLAEQTMEPYLYTGNNPIMFTDPTGMSKDGIDSDYRLNRDGTFTLLKNTKDKYDRIFSENKDDNPLILEKSFMKSFSKPKYEGTYEAKISSKDMKTYGKAIFRFFANNTDKEWDYNEFTNNKTGERTGNIITSLHEGSISNPDYYIKDVLDSDSNITWDYSVHNHPGKKDLSTFYPSGWLYNRKKGTFSKTITTTGKVDGDRGVYNSFKIDPKYNYRMPKYHHVTSPYLNKTIKYTDEKFNYIN